MHHAGSVLCHFFLLYKSTVHYPLQHRGDNNDYYVLPLYVSGQSNKPPCCQHQYSNLQQQPPSSPCCWNHWTHTSCLLCVFTTHSPNYSGTKQLNSMRSHSVHLPCGLRDYANAPALHTPSCTSLTHSARDCPGQPGDEESRQTCHLISLPSCCLRTCVCLGYKHGQVDRVALWLESLSFRWRPGINPPSNKLLSAC